VSATFHRPGQGEVYEVGGSSLTLKATSDDTAGSFFLSESKLEPGFTGPPLHVHRELHDMFYVLDGTLTVQVENQLLEAPPGSFLCVPPGTRHTFANRSEYPVRFLNFNTPGGFEEYMRELAAAWKDAGGPPPPEQIGEIASRYDFELAGPPIEA
jgi:quercetin dioxygenase-like cupin family protein